MKNNLAAILVVAVVVAAILAALFGLNYFVRWSSNATTVVTVVNLANAEGVRCALASTSNGVALDCDWSKAK